MVRWALLASSNYMSCPRHLISWFGYDKVWMLSMEFLAIDKTSFSWSWRKYFIVKYCKVGTFWETHKIWKNLSHGFDKSADLLSKRQNHEEDFFKICVLLKSPHFTLMSPRLNHNKLLIEVMVVRDLAYHVIGLKTQCLWVTYIPIPGLHWPKKPFE